MKQRMKRDLKAHLCHISQSSANKEKSLKAHKTSKRREKGIEGLNKELGTGRTVRHSQSGTGNKETMEAMPSKVC